MKTISSVTMKVVSDHFEHYVMDATTLVLIILRTLVAYKAPIHSGV